MTWHTRRPTDVTTWNPTAAIGCGLSTSPLERRRGRLSSLTDVVLVPRRSAFLQDGAKMELLLS